MEDDTPQPQNPCTLIFGIVASFGAYYCKNKAWLVFVGLDLPPSGNIASGNDIVDTCVNFVLNMLGSGVKKIGFQLSSKVREERVACAPPPPG